MDTTAPHYDDDAIWQVLTAGTADAAAPVAVVQVVSVSPDVAVAAAADSSRVLIPATEFAGPPPRPGARIAGHLTGARTAGSAVLTCTRPTLVPDILAGLVPELRDGTVRVMGVARVPGTRTKVAVAATVDSIDPVAAVVGKRASRVTAAAALLGGERIDVVGWDPDPVEWLRRALAPAQVGRIVPGGATTFVEAPAHLMSAAVGSGGLNSALAGRLVGTRVHVVAPGTADQAAADALARPAAPDAG